ncbi:hypothetical protein NYO98_18925 [Nocardioides sp. STR2]|uniref:Secreted protein n=1 Tax=Nocardioides pini TaxID=2975053 RepID=A0ABT4CHB4_9ACTN|nr:hypothetical protein [Nocardioides pini]MCY4728362.1 hypothetical protein [Nocardioides pini]
MPKPPTVPVRLGHVLAGVLVVLGSTTVARAAAEPGPHDRLAGLPGPCADVSTDPADFPRAVPLPQGAYTVRGFIRADCRQFLDLAMDTEDLGPEERHLVRRLRAKGFRGVTSDSRTVEVDMGPDAPPELREEYTIRAYGRGLRVKVELGFVGAAPRWGGTALVRYVLRPLR